MLCHVIHSLLLLPVHTIRPLLHELLSLLPHMDKLNRMLPAAAVLEEQELEWPLHGKTQNDPFSSSNAVRIKSYSVKLMWDFRQMLQMFWRFWRTSCLALKRILLLVFSGLFFTLFFKTTSPFISGTPESIDPSSLPLPQPAKSWVWLVDVERACALLIGRCLGGMLIGSPMSREERDVSCWLSNHLFSNGLHTTGVELGMSELHCSFPHLSLTRCNTKCCEIGRILCTQATDQSLVPLVSKC